MALREFVRQHFAEHKNNSLDLPKEPTLYQFNPAFYRQNPTVLHGLKHIIDLFRSLPHVTVPRDDVRDLETNVQFALGPAGSGAVMHFHQPAVNYLAFGRKRWSLLLPDDALYSDLPSRTWVEQYVESSHELGDRHLQCTQNAGDLMVLPLYFGHSTLNLEASIGFAFEFHYDPSVSTFNFDDIRWPPAERR